MFGKPKSKTNLVQESPRKVEEAVEILPVPIPQVSEEVKQIKESVESVEEPQDNFSEEEQSEEEYPEEELTKEKIASILEDHEKRLRRIEYHLRLDFDE